MTKKILSSLLLLSTIFMPIFWVELRLPSDHAGDDINITIEGQTKILVFVEMKILFLNQ